LELGKATKAKIVSLIKSLLEEVRGQGLGPKTAQIYGHDTKFAPRGPRGRGQNATNAATVSANHPLQSITQGGGAAAGGHSGATLPLPKWSGDQPAVPEPPARPRRPDHQTKPWQRPPIREPKPASGGAHVPTEGGALRAKVVAFYERYNRSKLDEVDAICAKYKGRGNHLLLQLEARYGRPPWIAQPR
jgi:hypothetical protein